MSIFSECIVVAGPIQAAVTWSADMDIELMAGVSEVAISTPPCPEPTRPLHRLRDVRRREGFTRRQVARRMGTSVQYVEQQESPSSDMLLSELQRWQKALGVPVSELLHEPTGELSPPVRLRAKLLRAMKTVRSIQQRARHAPMQRLVETLISQLVEVMPELEHAAAWPTVGDQRKSRELGQAFFRRLTLDPLDEMDGPDA
jgi:transcriptional regulator with XRE-family HTH domain